jgi:hypothetical protein
MDIPKHCMVLDIESVGLHGEGFAAAYCIIDTEMSNTDAMEERPFYERESAVFGCPMMSAQGEAASRMWVSENLPAEILVRQDFPNPVEFRTAFWRGWAATRRMYPGVEMFVDVGWPVEARFLSACVDDDPKRSDEAPFPLHDITSMIAGSGVPLEHVPRQYAWELPEHDPLADVRHSARKLFALALHAKNMKMKQAAPAAPAPAAQ